MVLTDQAFISKTKGQLQCQYAVFPVSEVRIPLLMSKGTFVQGPVKAFKEPGGRAS